MKIQVLIPALAFFISNASNAASEFPELCPTVTFEAFGEPKQTVKECGDPNESFWLLVEINGKPFPPQGIGLVVPQTHYAQSNGKSELLTLQAKKENQEYTVRFQAVRNEKTFNWAGVMIPGEVRSLTLNGSPVKIRFSRQKT
ncbi:hypothetical protein BM451_10315 [Dickeya dadantii]|uniref:hypothetical protein n=1 Tax=Dickeya dadantii TaxID=204038 RepID=UPI000981C8BA|nr:hypothetical protein [Dickeya dadantii]OOC13647.1 hypothetical protein BM451_10315 [Dickeya dadantii]